MQTLKAFSLLLFCCLAGCAADPVIGTWRIQEVRQSEAAAASEIEADLPEAVRESVRQSAEATAEAMFQPLLESMRITFEADGTVITQIGDKHHQSQWLREGDTIRAGLRTFQIQGDQLLLEDTFVLIKD